MAMMVSSPPNLVGSNVFTAAYCMECLNIMGKDPNRDWRVPLDPYEPWRLTATLEGMWPRVPLDHTGPRRLLPFRSGLVPVSLSSLIAYNVLT
ncbi:hypothetical protein CRG98_017829 [Punica granatum]|uniref:Uncharacterized protein n=1 Tax=Punica granatum TaxID=22663 RepID=A0A2I0JZN8_PUNGR|nr:hypothetical protein CRG98_017829 [Punica granatum]